ncbi:hypothetical protein EGY05_01710 [Chryseobacterium arthrosphaerae]|nr:hypothetical protein EGY05_01710 [Chryseobacterium arthrosphaerae]
MTGRVAQMVRARLTFHPMPGFMIKLLKVKRNFTPFVIRIFKKKLYKSRKRGEGNNLCIIIF